MDKSINPSIFISFFLLFILFNPMPNHFLLPAESIPEIDLAFAVSTTAANADATFARMRETVKHVIDMYGTDKIRYGLLVFGSSTSSKILFSDTYPDKDLKRVLDNVRPTTGDPDIGKALRTAKKLFEDAPSRPNAKKVLVVIVDNKSVNGLEELKIVSRPLHDYGIKVRLNVGHDDTLALLRSSPHIILFTCIYFTLSLFHFLSF